MSIFLCYIDAFATLKGDGDISRRHRRANLRLTVSSRRFSVILQECSVSFLAHFCTSRNCTLFVMKEMFQGDSQNLPMSAHQGEHFYRNANGMDLRE